MNEQANETQSNQPPSREKDASPRACCEPKVQAACCAPEEKTECCGADPARPTCGC